MKNIYEWRRELNEFNYNQQLDGPPLNPSTVRGAESQIQHLAYNIRKFMFRPEFSTKREVFLRMTQLMDEAAQTLAKNLTQEERDYRVE